MCYLQTQVYIIIIDDGTDLWKVFCRQIVKKDTTTVDIVWRIEASYYQVNRGRCSISCYVANALLSEA